MKFKYCIILFFFGKCFSQEAIQNNGNIQMHENAEVGFHIDLINNGKFNENLGTALFYNTNNSLSISGTEIPRFYDMEVEVANHLYLDVNTEVVNSVSYIAGDVITPRDNPNISLDYLEDAFYILDDADTNTDGYASYSGNFSFTFPIGDNDKLRPLITTNNTPNTIVAAAYFDENPNFPSSFITDFDTSSTESILSKVSDIEFWDFDGPENSFVTLTWDAESEIDNLVEDLRDLRVVGWHIADEEWKDLGNSNVRGDFSEGTINSFVFNPQDYEILTFGTLITEDGLTVYNIFTPNDDGNNDTFYIEGIELLKNELKIYNRWGNLVYQTENYKNDWKGKANAGRVFLPNKKLPAGTYFYTLYLVDDDTRSAGWIYINY